MYLLISQKDLITEFPLFQNEWSASLTHTSNLISFARLLKAWLALSWPMVSVLLT